MASDLPRLGFGSARKVGEFFSVSEQLVRDRAATGEWPSYCIGGRRVFDLEELVKLVKARPSAPHRMTRRGRPVANQTGQ